MGRSHNPTETNTCSALGARPDDNVCASQRPSPCRPTAEQQHVPGLCWHVYIFVCGIHISNTQGQKPRHALQHVAASTSLSTAAVPLACSRAHWGGKAIARGTVIPPPSDTWRRQHSSVHRRNTQLPRAASEQAAILTNAYAWQSAQ